MNATLKFPSRDLAKTFAEAWLLTTRRGYDLSPQHPDGSAQVTLYGITDSDQQWIESKVAALNSELLNPPPVDPLFSGCFPTGIVYADRTRERHGDYVRLGYLNYGTLALELEPDCPHELAERIRQDAARIQARKGESFRIAGNCSVILGSNLPT